MIMCRAGVTDQGSSREQLKGSAKPGSILLPCSSLMAARIYIETKMISPCGALRHYYPSECISNVKYLKAWRILLYLMR